MAHTVAIYGANGLVGGATAKKLAQSAKDGIIHLVIAHRSGSPPKGLEAGSNIEFRELNLDDPASKIEEAVKGINVFMLVRLSPMCDSESSRFSCCSSR